MGSFPLTRENSWSPLTTPGPAGSSPLTRGKRLGGGNEPRVRGLIPAHAGKTPPSGPCRARARAHPRSRGENISSPASGVRTRGSSPLTRGKRHSKPTSHVRPGLIPAHAGKTPDRSFSAQKSAAHPRSRGENSQSSSEIRRRVGSSPLTRGKLVVHVLEARGTRLIPAHAGKTDATLHVGGAVGAHPRSRGENSWYTCWRRGVLGSSPLTRGKRWDSPP